MLLRIATPGTALLICGCASTLAQDAPALLSEPDTETHTELVRVVSAALKVPAVTIAADALTRDSTLLIEHRPARDSTGQRLSGRDIGKPEQFQLTTDGKHCILVHLRTGERYVLAHARCKAEKKRIADSG